MLTVRPNYIINDKNQTKILKKLQERKLNSLL